MHIEDGHDIDMTIFDLSVMVSRLEPGLRTALTSAVARALTRAHPNVEASHWLAELVDLTGLLRAPLRDLDVPVDRVATEVSARIDKIRGGHEGSPGIGKSLVEWIQEAWITASMHYGRDEIAPADLLVAIYAQGSLNRLMRDLAPSLIFKESSAIAMAERVKAVSHSPVLSSGVGLAGTVSPSSTTGTEELDRYTVDLSAQASAGKLDPVIGREAEIRQVLDILMRRRQNNPILTGEAGVGKTAIVEALAMRIAEDKVPEALRGVSIRALDLGLLQAGAGVKGEFERRLTEVIAEIKASTRPIILFIDEAHVMIGAGNQAGGSDAANLLKPALARGELRTIAATTWSEYKRYIERDPALTRRFQVVKIEEPRADTAVRMLRGIVPSFERHHGVRIKDEALVEAVRLSARHLPERQLPDKAISVLDTAAAGVAISRSTEPATLEDLEAEARHLVDERGAILRDESLDMDAELLAIDARIVGVETELLSLRSRLDRERLLIDELDSASRPFDGEDTDRRARRIQRRGVLEGKLLALQGETPLVHRSVDRDAVASVIARWTGVPAGRLVRDAIRTAMSLEDRLRERVVGQDRALAVIASAMRSSAAKMSDPRKPPGVFLMVGTSGIGKTETALALADQLFGGTAALTIINMSEFKEEHKVSSLVGSPPGYVGYGEGGVLTEAVRRRPYGLLLLDEVEKAHPGVQDVFYQVFDKGMLRDGEGRDIEFLNTTIILTSNAGSETLATLAADPETMPEGDALVEALQPELAKHFKPAFLGRVTIVPYVPLSEAVLHDIALIQIERIASRLREAHKATLVVSAEVENAIVSRCLAGSIGARAIEGVLSREILPLISDLVLTRSLEGIALAELRIDWDPARGFVASVTDADGVDVPKPLATHHAGGGSDDSGADAESLDLAPV